MNIPVAELEGTEQAPQPPTPHPFVRQTDAVTHSHVS